MKRPGEPGHYKGIGAQAEAYATGLLLRGYFVVGLFENFG